MAISDQASDNIDVGVDLTAMTNVFDLRKCF